MANAPLDPENDPRAQAFIEWLCTPPSERDPASMELLAPILGVHPKTLSNWKKNKDFRRLWAARSEEVIGDPDRVKEVMDALFYTARDKNHRQHVSAARTFLEAVHAITPPPLDININKSPEKLTDEELDALVALGARELQQERDARANG